MVQKVLMIFCFETGDASVPYWDEAAIVEVHTTESMLNVCNELEDSMSSYLEAHLEEDIPHYQIVADVLNASGRVWERTYSLKPAHIDAYRILFI